MPHPVKLILLGIVLAAGEASGGSQVVATQDSTTIAAYNAKQFVDYVAPYTVDQLIDNSKDGENELTIVSAPRLRQSDTQMSQSDRKSYLLLAAANADLVLIGEPIRRHSELTQGNTFVFSDYLVAVDQVFAAKGVTVLPGQPIIVARPGGIVHYRGKQITGSVFNFPLFHLHDKYVMFLRFIPETGSFFIFAEAAFDIEDQTVVTRSGRYTEKEEHSRGELLDDVRKAVANIDQGRQK